MALGILWSLACLIVFLVTLTADRMGIFNRKNHFPVQGRTVVVTGGSQGMGRSVGRQLAERGANVVIVARGVDRLKEAIAHISGALDSERQCFHYISADLSNAAEATRVLVEITAWNGGLPPDVVWCVAGAAHPTLFADTPVDVLRQQMDTNYFSAAYIGHAALQVWVKQPSEHAKAPSTTSAATATPLPPRHLIFTSSVIAFYTFAGYAPYSPAKAALRGLGDVLANEVRLYDAGGAPPIRVHTVFPATIDSPGYSFENSVKSDLTKKLEEGDEGQTPEEVARACIAGLERGDEAVATPFFPAWIMMATQLGGTRRRGYGVVDMLLAWFMILVTPFVRWSHDKDVRNWGKDHGPSGMKRA